MAMDPEERLRLIDDLESYRAKLRDRIITLSAGTIVVSVNFLHNFKTELDADGRWGLAAAWIAFGLALVTGLLDVFVTHKLIAEILEGEVRGSPPKGLLWAVWGYTMITCQFAMPGAFVAGVVFFIMTGWSVLF